MPQAVAAAASWAATAFVAAVNSGIVWQSSLAWQAAFTVSEIAITTALATTVSELTRGKTPGPPGSDLNLRIDAAHPRKMIVGVAMTGGSLVAHYSYGKNNYGLSTVVALADHRIEGVVGVYTDGRKVHDVLLNGVRTEITAFSYSGGARVFMTMHDGRSGQGADAQLIAVSAMDRDVVAGKKPAWTSNHTGRGVAYVHIEYVFDSDILTSPPEFLFLTAGAKLYDRRQDSTAGGSGAQRYDDPSTWIWSSNPAVALDHFLLGYAVEGEPLAFGVGLEPDEVPYAAFAAAADLSDEDIETGEGGGAATIKRYRANGVISAEQDYETVIQSLQIQMSARVIDLGGRIGILGGEARPIEADLTDQDLVNDEPATFEDKRRFVDLVGAVEGRYADPANLYEPADYPRQESPDAVFADGGEAQTATLNLPFEDNVRRAVRNASAYLKREQRQGRLVATFGPAAYHLEPGDWFTYTDPHYQLDAEPFEVIEIVKRGDFTVLLTGQAVNEDFVVFPTDEDPDLSDPPDIDPDDLLLDAPEFDVDAVQISAAGATIPALQFTLTSDEPFGRDIVIEYRRWDADDGDFFGAGRITQMHASEVTQIIADGLLPETLYKVRSKVRIGHRESPWTAWSGTIETGTYVAPAAVTAGGATPGSELDRLLSDVAGFFPGFAIVSAHGDLTFAANEDAAGSVTVSAGYFDHPVLGEITVADEIWFRTPWTTYLAPPNGWFGVIWSEEPVADRFADADGPIGEGNFFPAAYKDGVWTAYGRFSYVAETFTPELTDVVCAKAIKPLAEGSLEYSSADGITEVESYIRDTLVVNARLDTIEASVGEAQASITELGVAIVDEQEARATAIESVEASIGDVSGSVDILSAALATVDGRVSGYFGVLIDTGDGGVSFELMDESGGAPGSPSGLARLRAANFIIEGDVLVDGSVSAEKLAVTDLSAITANIGLLRTATSGARTEIEDNQIRVYDSSDTLRVLLGVW